MSQADTLSINEIFFSIQGESTHMGLPCIFVRLAFCNLRCAWCDSEYTFYEGKEMAFAELFDQLEEYDCKLIEITGGEPLAQENVFPFMTELADRGYEVLVETSGSIDISHVDERVQRIMDIKCPGSGMVARNRYKNLEYINQRDQLKFVIKDRHDYEWAKNMIGEHALTERCPVLMSPVFGELENVQLSEWILDDALPVRFQLQMHKYIWDPQQRGV